MTHARRSSRGRDTRTLAHIRALSSHQPLERAAAALFLSDGPIWSPADLVRAAGVSEPARIADQLRQEGRLVELAVSATRKVSLHRDRLSDWSVQVQRVLNEMHDDQPLRRHMDRAELSSRLSWLDTGVLARILERLEKDKQVSMTETGVGLCSRGPQLSTSEQSFLDAMVARFQADHFQPPTEKELRQEPSAKELDVRSLLDLAVANGDLVHLSGPIYLHAGNEATMRERIRERFAETEGLTVSDIRELLNTSRKFRGADL